MFKQKCTLQAARPLFCQRRREPRFRTEALSLSYYIYYRVAQPAQAHTLVRDLQADMKSRTGIAGRLLRKRDDPTTWMEIYQGVEQPDAFEQCLAAAVQTINFAAVLETGGVRHMECFED